MVTEVSTHKKLFSSLCIHIQQKLLKLMVLSRKEKSRIVVELHSQGKAYCESYSAVYCPALTYSFIDSFHQNIIIGEPN
jgi:hypothetical protein